MKIADLKKIFRKGGQVYNSDSSAAWPVHFARDWKIIVIIFAAGLIIISIFSLKIYLGNQIGGGYFTSETEPVSVSNLNINERKLSDGLLILETRQADYQKLKASQPKLVDPAL